MKNSQSTDTVIMISPDSFGFNPETAKTNTFQNKLNLSETVIRNRALSEFNNMVRKLEEEKIKVLILKSRLDVVTPDAVFPNNWFSHHEDGKLVLYPMMADSRRLERQLSNLKKLLNNVDINSLEIIDLTLDEKTSLFLEGTGSMVLDRRNKIAYAMESPRTVKEEFLKWCKLFNYEPVFFHASDKKNLPIYHTNVVMSIGNKFAIICLESIRSTEEKKLLINKLIKSGKKVIPISIDQMNKFCANLLEVKSIDGFSKIVLSKTAFDKLTSGQKKSLESFGKLIVVDISTIENIGGGSARCMMAEIY